ncbi:MAG: NAD(P)-dependent oxidoreductase [Candidatus Nanohaloarchaea archaeon]
MKVAWFDAESWEKEYVEKRSDMDIEFFEDPLKPGNAGKAEGYDAAAVFVSSEINEEVLERTDLDLVCCRSTGFDHVDLEAAEEEEVTVCNVPDYGGPTVAEHTFGLMLALSRKIHDAILRVEQDGSFDHSGLRGFDLHGKKLGVIGTGAIGLNVIKIAKGLGMEVIASDPQTKEDKASELGFMYVSKDHLLRESDVVTLHCPLNDATRGMLSEDEFDLMDDTMLINTARGGLVDTEALLKALEDGSVRSAGLDVLEEECTMEEDLEVIDQDDECDIETVLEDHMLIERDDVLVTPHNAFNSREAMQRIADATLENLRSQENTVS